MQANHSIRNTTSATAAAAVSTSNRMPNLASGALKNWAPRPLPPTGKTAFGYSSLLAEIFTDIEQFAGTCCTANNRVPVGLTKGFQRHRGDPYQKHNRCRHFMIRPSSPRYKCA